MAPPDVREHRKDLDPGIYGQSTIWTIYSTSIGGCGPGTMPAISGSSSAFVGGRSARSRSRISRRSAFFFWRSLRANSFLRFSKGFMRGFIEGAPILARTGQKNDAPHRYLPGVDGPSVESGGELG